MGIQVKLSPEKFKELKSIDEKLDFVYLALTGLDCRVERIEKRTWAKTIFAFAGGIVGGAMAYLGIHIK